MPTTPPSAPNAPMTNSPVETPTPGLAFTQIDAQNMLTAALADGEASDDELATLRTALYGAQFVQGGADRDALLAWADKQFPAFAQRVRAGLTGEEGNETDRGIF